MKLFDPRAALAEIAKQARTPATSATFATQPPKKPSYVADVATLQPQFGKTPQVDNEASASDTCYGFAFDGHPKTWTGKIVSLDEWRQLSEWDKHGSTGKLWNGLTQQWEAAE